MQFLSNLTGLSQDITLGVFGLPGFLGTVPVAYLVFLVVNRRNEHFRRSELLLSAAVSQLKMVANPTDTTRVYALNTAERDLSGMSFDEKERSAYLWGLLTMVPYLGGFFLAYALYRVDRDFGKHEFQEFSVIEEIQRGLGLPVSPIASQFRRWYRGRNAALFFFLCIATAGLFSAYWLYTSAHAPEAHFQVQSHLEDEVQGMLQGSPRLASTSSFGSSAIVR